MQAKYKVTYNGYVGQFGNPETLEENSARLGRELYQVSKSDPTFISGILKWMKQNGATDATLKRYRMEAEALIGGGKPPK